MQLTVIQVIKCHHQKHYIVQHNFINLKYIIYRYLILHFKKVISSVENRFTKFSDFYVAN